MNCYFAVDGNYGNVFGMVVADTSKWTESDWAAVEAATDWERARVAADIVRYYKTLEGE